MLKARSSDVSGGTFIRRIGWNGVAQIAPMLTQLALTPYFIAVLGLDGFGVWSLVLILIATLAALDGGIGASLARFFAVHAAQAARDATGRLLLASGAIFLFLGILVSGLAVVLGPLIAATLDLPPIREVQTVETLRWVGLLVLLALLNSAVAALLQANQQFGKLACSSVTAQLVFAFSALLLLRPGVSVLALVFVTALRYSVAVVMGLAFGARFFRLSRPLLPGRIERHEFRRYATRMQVSSLTLFFNGEFDALLVAAVLPVRYVGIFAAANQVASAARTLPLFAFPPLVARLSRTFGARGQGAVRVEADKLEYRWLPLALGYGAVATAAAGIGVPIWLGSEFDLAGVIAAILTFGYSIHVAVTAVRTCFVRAIGQPGLETRYVIVSSIMNIALSIPLILTFGIVGVAASTAVALIISSVYFYSLCRRRFGIEDRNLPVRWWIAIASAAAITTVLETLGLKIGWHGLLGLLATGTVAIIGLAPLAWSMLRERTTGGVTTHNSFASRPNPSPNQSREIAEGTEQGGGQ